eukprot:TRINITY_DN4692_c0_g1_i1.p1 TRINITY_DN4692_c0_g1~~TRINITY_DN4692_c0_g1_i1.p1  ORF type:complete len:564 (-),score=93.63 TRINITY_DN4692_c0_g1_i1:906-2573(-)
MSIDDTFDKMTKDLEWASQQVDEEVLTIKQTETYFYQKLNWHTILRVSNDRYGDLSIFPSPILSLENFMDRLDVYCDRIVMNPFDYLLHVERGVLFMRAFVLGSEFVGQARDDFSVAVSLQADGVDLIDCHYYIAVCVLLLCGSREDVDVGIEHISIAIELAEKGEYGKVPLLYHVRGIFFSMVGDFNRAIFDFNQAIVYSTDTMLRIQSNREIVWSYVQLGEVEKALDIYNWLGNVFNKPEYTELIFDIYVLLPFFDDPVSKVDLSSSNNYSKYLFANNLCEGGYFDKAIEILDSISISETLPHHFSNFFKASIEELKSFIFFKTCKYDLCIEVGYMSLSLDWHSLKCYDLIIYSFVEMGDFRRAMSYIQDQKDICVENSVYQHLDKLLQYAKQKQEKLISDLLEEESTKTSKKVVKSRSKPTISPLKQNISIQSPNVGIKKQKSLIISKPKENKTSEDLCDKSVGKIKWNSQHIIRQEQDDTIIYKGVYDSLIECAVKVLSKGHPLFLNEINTYVNISLDENASNSVLRYLVLICDFSDIMVKRKMNKIILSA